MSLGWVLWSLIMLFFLFCLFMLQISCNNIFILVTIFCVRDIVFSKKCPYWMVLMLVYVEMAEGLVKPLVILPAAVMPLPSFILIFSQCHHPLCSHQFICSHNPLYPHLTLQTNPTLFIAFFPLLFPSSC